MCLEKGIWPSVLKTAEFVQNVKNGTKTNPINYRPIALVSSFTTNLERMLHNRNYEFFCEKENHCYKPLVYLRILIPNIYQVDSIYKDLDIGSPTIGVSLDMPKALFRVNESTSLTKLEKCGIGGLAHRLKS